MDEIREKKQNLRDEVAKKLDALSEKELIEKTSQVEKRLLEFANFLEANIVLLYINSAHEIMTKRIIERCFALNKLVVLPAFRSEKRQIKLFKVDTLATDLKPGVRGIPEPEQTLCKEVPIDRIDIAIIPGIVFDEKGSRLGKGEGYYDRLIPKLSMTTRKVSLAFESQIVDQVPMESHDKQVDIIVTEERVIYKI
ncbi:MAG: 5-formyltetrahydrofolate cyclo-ligase [Desulfobacterales bacterium]|nr:5-formyltetrahydrofolate cyclo-ligase [Desulfobacterales bacterium]MDD4070941.1 5-formyltetrahydrofolate cyclo-ligase [Desulfobacterales bacterium]MDD4393433.1 5-formyltetrahydrofolate cyclo-ligase [Desulfobacterales bacterium]